MRQEHVKLVVRIIFGNLLKYPLGKYKKMIEELQKRLRELEIFYNATLGREGRIIELKHQINDLLEKLGKEKKYKVLKKLNSSAVGIVRINLKKTSPEKNRVWRVDLCSSQI